MPEAGLFDAKFFNIFFCSVERVVVDGGFGNSRYVIPLNVILLFMTDRTMDREFGCLITQFSKIRQRATRLHLIHHPSSEMIY